MKKKIEYIIKNDKLNSFRKLPLQFHFLELCSHRQALSDFLNPVPVLHLLFAKLKFLSTARHFVLRDSKACFVLRSILMPFRLAIASTKKKN